MAELKIICMSDVQSEPVNWLWEPYIPCGAISLIQGDGELGKTTMAMAIAAAMATGGSLPGQAGGIGISGGGGAVPAPSANVIVQNGEDSYSQTIKPRLEKLGADCDRVFTIDEEDEALTFSDERIEQTILRTNAKLIILDPVQAYWGKANMNTAGSVRPILKPLGAVAERTGCAVILIGHLNKNGRGKAAYRGLGSIDIFAAARSVLTVGKTDLGDNIRAVVHNKSNLAPAGKSLAYGLDPVSGFVWMGEYDTNIDEILSGKRSPKPENQFAKARKFIENTLRNGAVPSADILEMAEDQGISEKTLYRAKSELGVISVKLGGVWHWELPIEATCTEVFEGGHQNAQGGHGIAMTMLPILNLHDDSGHCGQYVQDAQGGHDHVETTIATDLSNLPSVDDSETEVI